MPRHLAPLIPRHRPAPLFREDVHGLDHRGGDSRGGAIPGQMQEHQEPAGPLDQIPYRGPRRRRTENQIPLPMPGNGSVFDLGRPVGDHWNDCRCASSCRHELGTEKRNHTTSRDVTLAEQIGLRRLVLQGCLDVFVGQRKALQIRAEVRRTGTLIQLPALWPKEAGFFSRGGGSDGRRSRDLSIFSRTLYQLSYRALRPRGPSTEQAPSEERAYRRGDPDRT